MTYFPSEPPTVSQSICQLFLWLPNDIWRVIFGRISPVDIFLFRCTCRSALFVVSKVAPQTCELSAHSLYLHATSYPSLLRWLEVDQQIKYPKHRHSQLLAAAVAANNVDSMQWILERQNLLTVEALQAAAKCGHLALLQQFAKDHPNLMDVFVRFR